MDNENREPTERQKEERPLEELRFVPGDYLCVSVILPKSATAPAVQGEAGPNKPVPGANGWRGGAHALQLVGEEATGGANLIHLLLVDMVAVAKAGRDPDCDRTREPEGRVSLPRRDSPSGSRSRSLPR